VRLIITVAAGGPIDTIGRMIAENMQSALGQPVIVENKPGAGGTLGAKFVETAPPDGYTLLLSTLQTYGIATVLYAHQGYSADKFIPVGLVAEFPFVFVVPASVPATSPAEFVAFAKQSKEPLSFGGSLATPAQLLGMLFNRINGLDITYVPYRGLAPSMADLLSARTHMAFDALTTLLPLINEGKLRPLSVLSRARLPALPNVPTMAESGYANFPTNPWTGVVAPPGTPDHIVNRVNTAINAALATPQAKQRMQQLSLLPLGGSPEDFSKKIKADIPVWQEIVRLSGAKAE
jgi:tripartite-type tricarboxylate transporter receptor subunit TctC